MAQTGLARSGHTGIYGPARRAPQATEVEVCTVEVLFEWDWDRDMQRGIWFSAARGEFQVTCDVLICARASPERSKLR